MINSRMFDDFKVDEIPDKYNEKNEQIKYVVENLHERCKNGEIKDILIIARTTDNELGPKGLPQNVMNYCSVDDDYEINVFSRFALDILFSEAKCIVGKMVFDGVLNELKKDCYITDEIIDKFKNK